MTGSGTLLDPYVIWDVNDLQAVRNDPDKYYELGTDIDASATIGWFGGRGFEPLDFGQNQPRRPTGDHSSTGAWTVFPAAPPTLFDKVNEQDCDEDASYVRIDAVGGTVLFTGTPFAIPAGSIITSVTVYPLQRSEVAAGVASYRGYLRVGGANYQYPFPSSTGTNITYRWHYMQPFNTNPATGLAWTVDDVNGVGADPLQAWGLVVSGKIQRISKVYCIVRYSNPTLPSFDGKGHTVTNLYLNRGDDPLTNWRGEENAPFGYAINGDIKNLNLTDVDVTGEQDCAGICAWFSNGSITGCHVTGTIVGNVVASRYAGGIAAIAYHSSEIRDCSFSGTIDLSASGAGWHNAGGIVGYTDTTDIMECQTSGIIVAPSDLVGGVVGEADDSNIHDCSSSMTVGGGDDTGGIVGYATLSALAPLSCSIERCWNTGNVSGDDDVGGLCGYADSLIIAESYSSGDVVATGSLAGGLVGNNGCLIRDSYARGDVTGDDVVGGLVGDHWDYSIDNSYSSGLVTMVTGPDSGGLVATASVPITDSFWDTQASGQLTSAGGTGRTTAEMRTRATFTGAGWDFATIWAIGEVDTDPATSVLEMSAVLNGSLIFEAANDDYPYLLFQTVTPSNCYFEWGTTIALANTTVPQSKARGELFTQALSGLVGGRTYYFRSVATGSPQVYGPILSFITPLVLVSVQTLPATHITGNSARLHGMVISDGGRWGYVRFQWGLTADYGANTPWVEGYEKGDEFEYDLSELAEGMGYHFRAQFRHISPIFSGQDMVFSTLSPEGPLVLVTEDQLHLLEAAR